jgi:hypothetical protein
MPSYRYRTKIFIGAWHRTRRDALREAVADDAASWRSKARDEIDWHGDGTIEEADEDHWKGAVRSRSGGRPLPGRLTIGRLRARLTRRKSGPAGPAS